MLSSYVKRAVNYLTNDSNNSRKRDAQEMNMSHDVDYVPVPKRIKAARQDTDVPQTSIWGSISNKVNQCKGFFSRTVQQFQQGKRNSNMESSRIQRNWVVKNAHKLSSQQTLTRNPLQQSQHYNPFASSLSNTKLLEVINIDDEKDDDDDDCVELPSSGKTFSSNYKAIDNSEEENFRPPKTREVSRRKSSFLSLKHLHSPKIAKKSKKRKIFKTRSLFCPSMLGPAIESYRQDEKEKYQMLLQQQSPATSSYSSFQEADLNFTQRLPHRKTVSAQTEKNGAFFKVNLTDSDKIDQIKNIKEKRSFELVSWDRKFLPGEHVFQVPRSRSVLPMKVSSQLYLPPSFHLLKTGSTESPSLTPKLVSLDKPSSFARKPDSSSSNFKSAFSDTPVPIAKRQFSVKSLERKSMPRSSVTTVRDEDYFSDSWFQDLRDTVVKSTRTQSEKAQYEERKYQIRHERKLDEKFQANRKSLQNIDSKFGKMLIAKYDESDDEDSYQLPILTKEMHLEIDHALRPNPQDEVLVQSFGIKITRKDMETLSGLNWLNDEIINFYTNLMMERGKNENFPSCYAFNTFFYPRLISSGHSGLRRWTRKIDIFSHDLILIPVHLGMHWCLAVIDFRHKKIQYYDSMGGQNNDCLNALKNYLQDESMDKKSLPYDTSDWKLESVKNIPQQMNGSDCGMFTCKFAEYITRNAKITFSQKDMPYFRRLMVYEIINKKLM